MNKLRIAVVFGGVSSEHEVSCMSVANVVSWMDPDKYEIILLGITRHGRWLKADSLEDITSGAWHNSRIKAVISPDATDKCVILMDGDTVQKYPVDCVFPVLHGIGGEDGTIQGLCELAGIPYVGCGVLSSAVTIDKIYTKIIVDGLGIRQAQYETVMAADLEKKLDAYVETIEKKFPYPVFIKPSCGGSSCGVSRADDRTSLIEGLRLAASYDRKILVEEMICGREIECAVLGSAGNAVATNVGEILAAADFYDYDSKYNNPVSQTVIGPELPGDAVETIRKHAVEIFRAVDGYGLSRVDFFVKDDGEVVFNEINTIPGFTGISMYPMLCDAAGCGKEKLVDRLIELAMDRFNDAPKKGGSEADTDGEDAEETQAAKNPKPGKGVQKAASAELVIETNGESRTVIPLSSDRAKKTIKYETEYGIIDMDAVTDTLTVEEDGNTVTARAEYSLYMGDEKTSGCKLTLTYHRN